MKKSVIVDISEKLMKFVLSAMLMLRSIVIFYFFIVMKTVTRKIISSHLIEITIIFISVAMYVDEKKGHDCDL